MTDSTKDQLEEAVKDGQPWKTFERWAYARGVGHLAEDAWQEALRKTLDAAPSLASADHVRAYLFRAAQNETRRKPREPQHTPPPSHGGAVLGPENISEWVHEDALNRWAEHADRCCPRRAARAYCGDGILVRSTTLTAIRAGLDGESIRKHTAACGLSAYRTECVFLILREVFGA